MNDHTMIAVVLGYLAIGALIAAYAKTEMRWWHVVGVILLWLPVTMVALVLEMSKDRV
jgi:hypothetical protein